MQDCAETAGVLDQYEAGEQVIVTNGDLARKVKLLRKDLAICNADKAGLRAWSTHVSK